MDKVSEELLELQRWDLISVRDVTHSRYRSLSSNRRVVAAMSEDGKTVYAVPPIEAAQSFTLSEAYPVECCMKIERII